MHAWPPDDQSFIDQRADSFEQDWRAGRHPRIEDYLAGVAEPRRARLFEELLQVERDLCRRDGVPADPGEYQPRFPEYAKVVDAVFATPPPPITPHGPPETTQPRDMASNVETDVGARRSISDPLQVNNFIGNYQIICEIGRGGMGRVLKCHDSHIGRDLAIKVLLEKYRNDPDATRRFKKEGQICGRLQHPGIVPVHELGADADRLPFFTMKLVEGQTLAALLAGRPHPSVDLPRFLTIFESVCQTLAYAHARRVIHRDLKPSNVMVGSFGEVQIMDWGLAKVLPDRGADNADAGMTREEPAVATAHGGESHGDFTAAGHIMGTFAYMPPEQAQGKVDQIDERADVFALGAILCEILTGRPPYEGASLIEIRNKAAAADLADALDRLGACGADAELVALARRCLEAAPDDRPRDAQAVCNAVTAYLAGVQERLRMAERAWHVAQAKAIEEKKRQRLAVALAGAILALIATIGGGGAWLKLRREERAAHVDLALREAEVLRAQAVPAGADPARWAAARDACAGPSTCSTTPATTPRVRGSPRWPGPSRRPRSSRGRRALTWR